MALRKKKTPAPAPAPVEPAPADQMATPEDVDAAFGMTKADTYGTPAKTPPSRGYDYDRGY